MNKISNFLWKIFTTFVVFNNASDANAEGYTQTHTLCRTGYYVSKCGTHNVGTYWLKGYQKSNLTTSMLTALVQSAQTVSTRAGTIQTRTVATGVVNSTDYYDYSGTDNIKNLRKFFAGTEPIVYTNFSGMRALAQPATYLEDRNGLLAAICDPTQVQVGCTKCPGVAKIPESTVDMTYDSASIIASSWKFHTIADCYMQEFADSTGIFEYVDDNNTPQTCYYNSEITGDALTTGGSTVGSQYDE